MLLRLLSGGLGAVCAAVGGLGDQGLQAGEVAYGGIKEPGPLELLVPGECHIVQAISDMKMGNG